MRDSGDGSLQVEELLEKDAALKFEFDDYDWGMFYYRTHQAGEGVAQVCLGVRVQRGRSAAGGPAA